MKKYEGIFPALITPFDENGNVKENGLRQIINHLINVQKVDGLYVTGSTGEFLLLSFEERKRILEIVAEEAKGKVTLIAQIGDLNIKEVIALGKVAEKLGYDAISAITPYYYGFSFEEVKNFYAEISKNVNLPMFIYYLPQLAGSKMGVEQLGEILKLKNVIGCKYGSTDIFTFERLLAKYPNKVFMFAYDEALSTGLLLGAKGFIGSTYNVNTKAAKEIIKLFSQNKPEELRKAIHKYNDYVQALVSSGLMQTLKAIMQLSGVDAGVNKLPFRLIPSGELKTLAEKIKKEFLN